MESGFETFLNATEAQKIIRLIIKISQISKANRFSALITDELGKQEIWDFNCKDKNQVHLTENRKSSIRIYFKSAYPLSIQILPVDKKWTM